MRVRLAIVLSFLVTTCQIRAEDLSESVGRVEQINKNSGQIAVRDNEAKNRQLFYFTKATEFTKDGEPSSIGDLHKADVVVLSWKMQEGKRVLKSLAIRPTLNPDKFEVGQIGYFPPQNDKYYYVVEAASDSHTVLIREISFGAQPVYRRAYQDGQWINVVDHMNYVKKEGEQFFLGGVKAEDFPVGRKVTLKGRWRVKSGTSTNVTKDSSIVTTKTDIKTEGQRTSDTKVLSNRTGKTDTQVDTKGKGQGKVETTTQREMTTKVSGFLLVAETEKARKAGDPNETGKQAEKQKAADDSNEASAKSALRLIEQLIAEGKNDTAKFRLEKFLEKYPGTRAAAKAKELLDSLP
jgi:hypothetical protein